MEEYSYTLLWLHCTCAARKTFRQLSLRMKLNATGDRGARGGTQGARFVAEILRQAAGWHGD
jgi:hypothetical protein